MRAMAIAGTADNSLYMNSQFICTSPIDFTFLCMFMHISENYNMELLD